MPSLVAPVRDWRRVRHNYYQLLLEQFIDRWGKPCYDYCERNGLEFTGHYGEHGWPGASHVSDNMARSAAGPGARPSTRHPRKKWPCGTPSPSAARALDPKSRMSPFSPAVYQLTVRGNERRAIYRDDHDRERFLETLDEARQRFGLLIHGFCLMRNHYHLLAETPRANLSAAVASINSSSVWRRGLKETPPCSPTCKPWPPMCQVSRVDPVPVPPFPFLSEMGHRLRGR